MSSAENSESKQLRREMQEKLNKQYIDTKVHPIIEPMATALFTQATANDDPVSFDFHVSFFRSTSCSTI